MSMGVTKRSALIQAACFLAAATLTVACYWVGLGGGFLLDDWPNFEQLFRYAKGEIDARGVIFTNASGPLGRPLSMASFVLTTEVAGTDPWAFRFMNLGLHVTNGALIVLVVYLVGRSADLEPDRNAWLSVAAGAFWLLIPLHVSTVLYPVQRMSQLSALFVLFGLALFLTARAALLQRPGSGSILAYLIMAMAVTTGAAVFAKENGALLPLLCATLHYGLPNASRLPALNWLFASVVVIPGVLILVALATSDYLALGYQGRAFTLEERLLTQPRVLWDYVVSLTVPDVSRMSLIRDDFPVSKGMVSPPETLIAIVAWGLAVWAAVRVRKHAPLVGCGVLFFLAAHAMESSVLPLEMVFEHRNYLPSVGLVITLVGAVNWLLSSQSIIPRRPALLLSSLPLGLMVMNATAVHARAIVWSDYRLLLAHAYEQRPESTRLAGLYVGWLLAHDSPDAALRVLDRHEAATTTPHPAIWTWRLLATCRADSADTSEAYRKWQGSMPKHIDIISLQAAILLVDQVEAGACPEIGMVAFADDMASWARSLHMPPTSHPAWRFKLLAGRLYASAQQWDKALRLLDDAYVASGENVGVAVILFQVAMSAGRVDAARDALARIRSRAPAWDRRLQEAVSAFQAALDTAENAKQQ